MKTLLILITAFLLSGCVAPPDTPIAVKGYPDAWPGQNRTDVLIYNGPGTWDYEVESLKSLLYKNRATYDHANEKRLNQFTAKDFARYRMIVFVGGHAIKARKAITPETFDLLRDAIHQHGLNYLGFCAGAWMAAEPSVGIINVPYLEWNHLTKAGKNFALDEAIFPDYSRRKLLWFGGPITPNIPGGVIAKYSDGTPAITQMQAGRGFVILSGLHPAASKKMLINVALYEREAMAPEFAWQMIRASITGQPMLAFP